MHHDSRVRQCESTTLFTSSEKKSAHARCLPDADGAYRALHVIHGVINRHATRDDTARRVNINRDFLFRVFAFQVQKFRDDDIRHTIIDRRAQKNNSIFEQTTKNVPPSFAPMSLFNDGWN